MTQVPFLDLAALHATLRPELDEIWASTVDSSAFVGGHAVAAFEREFADYCGCDHAIGVANGTDALELVLRALGVGPGDEVIVPTNTFFATAEAVHLVGARPVFVDVDPGTLLTTPDIVKGSITGRTAAMIPVHLFGQPVDLTGFEELSRDLDIPFIEDAAQAHGARWGDRLVGSAGVAACFSFYPGKNLGALGDGGAVVTSDERLAGIIRSLANHGRDLAAPTGHSRVGRNSRLDGLQAGLLSLKLRQLDSWNGRRRRLWQRYVAGFAGTAVRCVEVADRAASVHHLAVVRVPNRDRVRAALAEDGIETGIHYPVPCHLLPPWDEIESPVLPVSEQAAEELLSLPMYPQLEPVDVDHVVERTLIAVDRCSTGSTDPLGALHV